ncbi:MAG: hypothetical protein ACLFU6_13210 [Candidatus Hydrogenedentota bacterium]
MDADSPPWACRMEGSGPSGGLIIGEKGSIAIDRGAYEFDPPELGEEPLEDPDAVLDRSGHHYRKGQILQ